MGDESTKLEALRIFTAAIELEGEAREAYLAEACAGDPALLARVGAMLAADREPNLLPTQGPRLNLPRTIPERVGSYRVTGVLGEGGMGVVYAGERADGDFERRVAIKFMSAAHVSAEVLQRFENERRITAALDHPNIAQLLDSGVHDGQPYLVMEFVEGSAFGSDPRFTQRELMAQFVTVCEAISSAHNAFVLHRDLKPGNILVTEEGVPKLLDFGIAKIEQQLESADPGLTRVGEAPMTRAYTSPECLGGAAATVQSEVYSLGVLLYEALLGSRPYDIEQRSLVEAHRYLSEVWRAAPHTGDRDLDTILKVALDPDPRRRYATVDELRRDVDAWLQRKPISARRRELTYVARRFVQRHKAAVASLAFGVAVLIGAFVVTTKAYLDADRARLVAAGEARATERALNFVENILIGANPYSGVPQSATIDDALAHADEQIHNQFSDDPETHAYLLSTLAQVFSGRGEHAKASEYVARAEQIIQEQGVNDLHARFYYNSASVFRNALDTERALALSRKAMALDNSAMPTAHRATLFAQHGEILVAAARPEEAVSALKQALALAETEPSKHLDALTLALNAWAKLDFINNDFDAARKKLQRALDHMQQAGRLSTPNGFQLRNNLANVLSAAGEHDEAAVHLRSTLAELQQALGVAHPATIGAAATLGMSLQNAGASAEAAQAMVPYLTHAETLPQNHHARADFKTRLGAAYCDTNRPAAGIELAAEGLEIRREIFNPEHWFVGDAYNTMAMCLMELHRFEEAVAALDQASDIFSRYGWDETHAAVKINHRLLARLQRLRDAVEL